MVQEEEIRMPIERFAPPAPGAPEGARSATGGAPGAAPTAVIRWSTNRKKEVVLRLMRGESLDALSRELGVESYRLDRWLQRAMAAIDEGLRERGDDPLERQLREATHRIGELSLEVDVLRREREARRPFGKKRSSR
jgi:hypothetical protein